jgi:hypothetical protein
MGIVAVMGAIFIITFDYDNKRIVWCTGRNNNGKRLKKMKHRITIKYYPSINDPEKSSGRIHYIVYSVKFFKWWIPITRYVVPLKY